MIEMNPVESSLFVAEDGPLIHITFPTGEASGSAVRELYETAALKVTSSDRRLLIDFEGVELVNSGAMGMMITLQKRCMNEGAQLHISLPAPMVRRTFEIMNLHLVLKIYESAEAAIAAFKG